MVERAKPRKIEIAHGGEQKSITVEGETVSNDQ